MADSSVNAIEKTLVKHELLDEGYDYFESNLSSFMFLNSISVQNIESNIVILKKYAPGLKIYNALDFVFLTLEKSEVENICRAFEGFNENISLYRLREFKEDPEGIIKRIKFCKIYDIPYKDENDFVFPEVSGEQESQLYLRAYHMKNFISDNNDQKDEILSEDVQDLFIQVCAFIQRNIYYATGKRFLINKDVEILILDIIKSNPEITVEEVIDIIKDKPELYDYKELFVFTNHIQESERDFRRR